MTIRIFCDACGGEIKDSEGDRLRRVMDDITVEVMVRYKGVWNGVHVCHHCIISTINHGQPAAIGDAWTARK